MGCNLLLRRRGPLLKHLRQHAMQPRAWQTGRRCRQRISRHAQAAARLGRKHQPPFRARYAPPRNMPASRSFVLGTQGSSTMQLEKMQTRSPRLRRRAHQSQQTSKHTSHYNTPPCIHITTPPLACAPSGWSGARRRWSTCEAQLPAGAGQPTGSPPSYRHLPPGQMPLGLSPGSSTSPPSPPLTPCSPSCA
jgi:hypothetical protein